MVIGENPSIELLRLLYLQAPTQLGEDATMSGQLS
jgi:hypothetical protein